MNIFLSSLLYATLLISLYMTLLYTISMILKRTDIIDIGWGLGFIFLTLTQIIKSQNLSPSSTILLTLVGIWGVRLATHIFIRNRKKKEDFRYKKFQNDWGKNFWWKSYFKLFLLQGFLLILISIPIISFYSQNPIELGWFNYISISIWLLGFLFELISDIQLSQFIKKKQNSKKKSDSKQTRFLTSGLWSLSRHPNYFGEIVLWWGIWIYCIDISKPLTLLTVIGPITISYLILFVSGTPLLEKKFKDNKEWEEYSKRVPKFFPFKLR